MEESSASVPTIPEFYRGRSVFITGATGFCGKVLLEKLLRSCPDIVNIYVTVRSKKGKPPAERLKSFFELSFFDRLKKEQPGALDKVVAIHGDITELGLGMSDQDRKTLQENVSVVFHVAAVVRFDDSLRNAVLMNIRGTREVLDIATGMKDIKAFLHVSTAYCNTDRIENKEQIYPAPVDWRMLIKAVETVDDTLLQIITPKLLSMRPNTYTFTKAVAEQLVSSYCDRLPVIINRPSIVISTLSEPIPGWIDNFNGPVGLMVATGKGIMRVSLNNPNVDSDYAPVDVVIKSMIVATWEKGVRPVPNECSVYNCATKANVPMKSSEVAAIGLKYSAEYPMKNILWIPSLTSTVHRTTYYFLVLIFHLLPAIIYDTVMRVTGGKMILVKLHRRIYIANIALSYFLLKEWDFPNERLLGLNERVLPEDRADWFYDHTAVDGKEFLHSAIRGGMLHLMKEDPAWLPEARRNYARMLWLDRTLRAAAVLALAWLVWSTGYIQQVYMSTLDTFASLNS